MSLASADTTSPNQWHTVVNGVLIRPITAADNDAIKSIILATLEEHGAVGKGYASGDDETQAMSNYYDGVTGQYWVMVDVDTQAVIGGGGYSRLKGTKENDAICELQKVYFLPQTRGKGIGQRLIKQCMAAAIASGYRTMYIETIPAMKRAAELYTRFGFEYLDTHWGATGHHNRCTIRLAGDLTRLADKLTGVDAGHQTVEKPLATKP